MGSPHHEPTYHEEREKTSGPSEAKSTESGEQMALGQVDMRSRMQQPPSLQSLMVSYLGLQTDERYPFGHALSDVSDAFESYDPQIERVLRLGDLIIERTIHVLIQTDTGASNDPLIGYLKSQAAVSAHLHRNQAIHRNLRELCASSLSTIDDIDARHVDELTTLDSLFSSICSSDHDHSSIVSSDESTGREMEEGQGEMTTPIPTDNEKASQLAILHELGAFRRTRADPYVDISHFHEPDLPPPSRGGNWQLFPSRLHAMLETLEVEGNSHLASFLPHGRAFRVSNVRLFVRDILPRFFSGTKWSSFSRQLQLYGFLRIPSGVDEGAYYHPLFLRGRHAFSHFMKRDGRPVGQDGRQGNQQEDDGQTPDFYAMPPV
jgi:hypothetical protein